MKRLSKAQAGIFSGLLCLMVMFVLLPASAFARTRVDSERQMKLTIICSFEGHGVQGVEFDLYKVANMNSIGEFSLTDEFAEYSVSLELDNAYAWDALAETLVQYARRDRIPAIGQQITDSNGKAVFSELDAGMYLAYGHRFSNGELVYIPKTFLVSLPGLDEKDDWVYDVTANCKSEGYAATSIKVLKVWKDEGHESRRPKEVEAQLLRNGTVHETVTLNADNNWRYTWTDLNLDYEWSVVEKEIPEDYTLLISREGITFLLTNAIKPAEFRDPPSPPADPKLPQTGQLWWPVPILFCAGLACWLAALLWKRPGKADEHE